MCHRVYTCVPMYRLWIHASSTFRPVRIHTRQAHTLHTRIMCFFHHPKTCKRNYFRLFSVHFAYLNGLRHYFRKYTLLAKIMKTRTDAYRFVRTYANIIGKQDRHTHECILSVTYAFKYVRLALNSRRSKYIQSHIHMRMYDDWWMFFFRIKKRAIVNFKSLFSVFI